MVYTLCGNKQVLSPSVVQNTTDGSRGSL